MKIYIAMALSVLSISQPRAHAQGWDDVITLGTTILGGVAGYAACDHQRDFVQLLCTGGGAGVGFLLGKAITSDADVRAYNDGFNSCMNRGRVCRPMPMQSGYVVYMNPGERVYINGQPNVPCRSYTEVVKNRRGRVVDQNTRYVCQNNRGQWAPAPARADIRFYNGPQYDARFRSWDYDAPVYTQPAPMPPQYPAYPSYTTPQQPYFSDNRPVTLPAQPRPQQPVQQPTFRANPPATLPAQPQRQSPPETLPYYTPSPYGVR